MSTGEGGRVRYVPPRYGTLRTSAKSTKESDTISTRPSQVALSKNEKRETRAQTHLELAPRIEAPQRQIPQQRKRHRDDMNQHEHDGREVKRPDSCDFDGGSFAGSKEVEVEALEGEGDEEVDGSI